MNFHFGQKKFLSSNFGQVYQTNMENNLRLKGITKSNKDIITNLSLTLSCFVPLITA
jgi:hypothetical protein